MQSAGYGGLCKRLEGGPGAQLADVFDNAVPVEWRRDQCTVASTPFMFKQWGQWRGPVNGERYDTTMGRAQRRPAFTVARDGTVHRFESEQTLGGQVMLRVGKKAAGRLLDGRECNGVPA